MPWASGVFQRLRSFVADAAQGINAEPGLVDSEFDNLAAGLQECLTRNGSLVPTADLGMGGNKHVSVGLSTGRGQYATVDQIQDGSYTTLVITQSTDGNAISGNPAVGSLTAYAEGQQFIFWPTIENTAPDITINISGLGASPIVKNAAGDPVGANFLAPDVPVQIVRRGGRFRVLSVSSAAAVSSSTDVRSDGRLDVVSTGNLAWTPANGNKFSVILADGTLKTLTIPATGISAFPAAIGVINNQSVTAGTMFYVYAYADGNGDPKIEIPVPPVVSVRNAQFGFHVKQGDVTRRRVGIVYCPVAAQWPSTNTLCASEHNRIAKSIGVVQSSFARTYSFTASNTLPFTYIKNAPTGEIPFTTSLVSIGSPVQILGKTHLSVSGSAWSVYVDYALLLGANAFNAISDRYYATDVASSAAYTLTDSANVVLPEGVHEINHRLTGGTVAGSSTIPTVTVHFTECRIVVES